MKPKSISGTVFQVFNLELTRDFYSNLGFRIGKESDNRLTCYVNWFWIEFQKNTDLRLIETSVQSLAISVEDVDSYYNNTLELGYHPDTQPTDVGNKRREFLIRDPSGHLLTFFQK